MPRQQRRAETSGRVLLARRRPAKGASAWALAAAARMTAAAPVAAVHRASGRAAQGAQGLEQAQAQAAPRRPEGVPGPVRVGRPRPAPPGAPKAATRLRPGRARLARPQGQAVSSCVLRAFLRPTRAASAPVPAAAGHTSVPMPGAPAARHVAPPTATRGSNAATPSTESASLRARFALNSGVACVRSSGFW